MCVHSWNLGPAHIISLSTEVYFYLEFGLELLFKQYEWLRKDLEVSDFIDRGLFCPPLLCLTLSLSYFPLSHSKNLFRHQPEL